MQLYRANLDFLKELFPNKAAVSLNQCAAVLGADADRLRADPHLIRFRYGKQERVTLPALAQYMTKEM